MGKIISSASSPSLKHKTTLISTQWVAWKEWSHSSLTFTLLWFSFCFSNMDNIDIHSVDSSWLAWGEWSHCSLSCGNGNRNRGRGCTGCRRVAQIDFHISILWKEESNQHILMLSTCYITLFSKSILQRLLLEDSTAQGAPKRRSIVTQFPVLVGFGQFWPPLLWRISFGYNISDQLVLNQ